MIGDCIGNIDNAIRLR